MADVQGFRGWRYDVGQVGSLGDVVAPPYDVISAEAQDELYKLHPCNVIRLILNRDEPGDASPDARYERAADFLRHWQKEGVLLQEQENALYVYHQIFEWEGQKYTRRGFLGRIRLEEFGKGKVYPHEQTMSGPKADRLKLTQACQTNLSPIFGLFPDPDGAVQDPLESVVRSLTPLEVTDDNAVLHRFWPVTDVDTINTVTRGMADHPVFIADGHHRYETACNYRNWLESEGRLTDSQHPANFVLMHFVGMSDPGLAILPTHRLVSGIPELSAGDVADALGSAFEVTSVGSGDKAADEAWQQIDGEGGQELFGLGTRDGQWQLARLVDASQMNELSPDHSDAWRGLGVSILHRLILEKLIAAKSGSEPNCKYVHLMEEVTSGLASGDFQLACLVAPASIDHVREIASRYEKMPPKSTFFYPKLLSGLVFHSLNE